jgi:hypothetical protein
VVLNIDGADPQVSIDVCVLYGISIELNKYCFFLILHQIWDLQTGTCVHTQL